MKTYLIALVVLFACSETSTATAPQQNPPLSTYVDGAVAAKLFAFAPDASGRMSKREVKQFDRAETKRYLARLDLAQRLDGAIVKCPSDSALELADASGKPLGTIGFCQGHARFDAPDGRFGGITAPLP